MAILHTCRAHLAILIPRVALLDRPEHGFLQLFQRHIVGITNRLELLVQIVERLDGALNRDLAERPGHFR